MPRPAGADDVVIPVSRPATGTPSCAAASTPIGIGWRVNRISVWVTIVPAPSANPRAMYDGWSPRARRLSDAPSQTKNSGPKNPSVMANSCVARRRGAPTPATAIPNVNPANMIDTSVRTASAANANRITKLIRSSSAKERSSEISCSRWRRPLRSTCRSTMNSTIAAPTTASAPSAACPACEGSIASGSATMQAASANAICGSIVTTSDARRARVSRQSAG